METTLLFWLAAAAAALACLAVVLGPLLRGAGSAGRRASFDVAVLRDQLREVDADRARGLLSPEEAAATRTELSRRLLAAADAEGAEAEVGAAPPRLSRRLGLALTAIAAATAVGLYARIGAPGFGDQPLQGRIAAAEAARAARPGQAEAEAVVAERGPPSAVPQPSEQDLALLAQLETVMAARPDDVEGNRLLARSYAALGRWPEARQAQDRVVARSGAAATAADLVDLAELSILAADGYVSPEAEAALSRVLTLEPGHKLGRYYSGLLLLQAGRPDLTYQLWSGLLAEGPPDAPWIAAIEAEIGAIARAAGLPPPEAGAAGPGAAAAEAEAQQAMIETMVQGLADRLAAEGGPPEDWAQLIRSLAVLGRRDEAVAIWREAEAAHDGDAAGLAAIDAAARAAGLE